MYYILCIIYLSVCKTCLAKHVGPCTARRGKCNNMWCIYIYIYIYIYTHTYIHVGLTRFKTSRNYMFQKKSTFQNYVVQHLSFNAEFVTCVFQRFVYQHVSSSMCCCLLYVKSEMIQSISEMSSCFFGPRPWHIEIRHRVKQNIHN